MAISARMNPRLQLALVRYCKVHGLSKTQALERGVSLLLSSESQGEGHPAYVVYQRMRPHLGSGAVLRGRQESIASMKRRLDEKYPG